MAEIKWPIPAAYIVSRAMAEDHLEWRRESNALANTPLFTKEQVEKLLLGVKVPPTGWVKTKDRLPEPKPPCAVCGTPYEKHGTAPTCASHDYTDGGHIVLLVPAGVGVTDHQTFSQHTPTARKTTP